MKKKPPLWIFAIGTILWGLIIAGFVIGEPILFGVAGGLFAVSFVTLGIRKIRRASAIMERRKRVWQNGQAGTALVLSISDSGGRINNDPKIDFELEVRPEDGDPYNVKTDAIVEQICIPQVQPQCEVRVRIDPTDPNFVVLDEKITSPWYLPRDS